MLDLICDPAPCALERLVAGEEEERIAHRQERVELEGELCRIDRRVELTKAPRILDRSDEQAHPVVSDLRDPVAHRAGPGIELGSHGGEETASGEHAPTHMREESLAQSLEPRQDPSGCANAGARTSSSKISWAVSIAASWSSSFEPKWANRPLLLIPMWSASLPIERPSIPSIVASWAAATKDPLPTPPAVGARVLRGARTES